MRNEESLEHRGKGEGGGGGGREEGISNVLRKERVKCLEEKGKA